MASTALAFALRPEVAPAHAGAGVDQHGDPPLLGVAEAQSGRLAEERPGERHGQEAQRHGPQEQQEPLVKAAPARQAGRRRGQEDQGAERQLSLGGAADQVEHDRGRDRQGPQDVEGRQEAHRAPPRPAAAPARRLGLPARRSLAFKRSKSISSRGESVVIDWKAIARSAQARSTSAACAANRAR